MAGEAGAGRFAGVRSRLTNKGGDQVGGVLPIAVNGERGAPFTVRRDTQAAVAQCRAKPGNPEVRHAILPATGDGINFIDQKPVHTHSHARR